MQVPSINRREVISSTTSYLGSEGHSTNVSDNNHDDKFLRLNAVKLKEDQLLDAPEEIQANNSENKLSSIMVVFNTWNAMIGCGTVTIPWAYQQSGIVLGVFLTAIACVFAFTTNYIILRVAGKDINFSDTMHRFFPSYGWSVSMVCFIVNFYVGIILFFQVLSQSLYPILLFIMGKDVAIEMKTDWSQFSLSYACLILLGIVLLMVLPRNTTYIQKVNAFGVVFVCIFLGFILTTGFKQMSETHYVYSEEAFEAANQSEAYTAWVPLAASKFTPLMGILGGGFYFHNMSLTMTHNAAHPEHNTRNIAIGFFLVFLTYSLIGVLGVYGFTGQSFAEFTPSTSLIKENCLNMFASDDVTATIIRGCILCQLLCVNTLLFGLLRSQILLLHYGITQGVSEAGNQADIQLSRGKNFVLSSLMTLPPIALAIWYPYVGKLGALIAAFSTMFVIFILPLATFTKAFHLEQQTKINCDLGDSDDDFEKILAHDGDYVRQTPEVINSTDFDQSQKQPKFTKITYDSDDSYMMANQSKEKLTTWSFGAVLACSVVLSTYGIAVFVIQLFYIA